MANKRSLAESRDDEDDESSRIPSPDDSSRESASPGPSKRSRRHTVNGTNGHLEDEDEDDEVADLEPSGSTQARPNVQSEGDEYKPGAIRRVKLQNFVTYEHAEFFPGPSLNMVLGPNGTGKSSLVCAICLGLGYPSKVLGRASAFGEFVKHGKSKAIIEVELQGRKGHNNYVVTLRINREDNNRKFWINGRESSLKKVQKLNDSLRIQIDNLCQFLPQDKVAEFAGLSPVDLLTKTLQAAAPPEMIEWQDELKELYQKQKEFQASHDDDAAQLSRLENRQESLQGEVERIRERQRITSEIEKLKELLIVVEYQDARQHLNDEKRQLKILEKQKRNLERRFAPALAAVNAKEAYKNQIHVVVDTRKRTLKDAEADAEGMVAKSDATLTKVQEIRTELEGNDRFLTEKKKDAHELRRKITGLTAQYKTKPKEFNPSEWNTKIREQQHRQRELETEIGEMREQVQAMKIEGNEKTKACGQLERKLKSLDSEQGRLRSQLARIHPDAAKGMAWLEENQDKFEKEVFGPPMLTCSVKDDRYRDVVQAGLQKDDFLCFVAQTTKDHKTLSHYLFRELGLSVAIRSSLAPYSQYRNPLPREQLKALGLDGYATDYIEGPEPVLAMLCGEKRLHTTAVGLNEISDDARRRLEKEDSIGQYIAGRFSYRTTRRKEYGPDATSTRVRSVAQGLFWTDQPVDTAEKTELSRQIEQAKAELDQLKVEYKAKNEEEKSRIDERQAIVEKVAELQKAKAELQREFTIWQSLPDKIETLKNALDRKLEEISELKGQRRTMGQNLDKAAIQQARAALEHKEAVAAIRSAYQAVLEAQVRQIEAQSDYESLKAEHSEMKAQLDQCAADIDAAKKKTKAAHEITTKFHEQVQELLLRWDAEELKARVEGRTAEMISADINTQELRLGGIETINPHALQEYERRAAEIDKLRREKAQREAEAASLAQAIKELRDKWEPGVDEVVSRINGAFSHNFEQINCAGEVDVHKDEDDFEKWAIQIRVRFRPGETLQILDQHRQSGGERAVSTIFYLMSLQAMAQAPFRVVDEINQGMDPRNERMVHERMVEIACREHTSQYFLITPKLLTGLRYDDRMKVHCIASGEHVPTYDERKEQGVEHLDFKMCAEIQKRAAAKYPTPEPMIFD